jgi:DNA-binding NtrC family response regulator
VVLNFELKFPLERAGPPVIRYSIVIVDDEKTIRDGIMMAFDGVYEAAAFADAEAALDALQTDPPDLVILDIGLPGMSGMDALKKIKAEHPQLPVIMITAYEDIDTVISAMKAGAHDYVVKPLHMDILEIAIENALDTIRLRKEVQALQERYLNEQVPCFIGESNVIQNVMDFIKAVAKSPDTPVLIQGETGTGKELIAGAIHYNSPNFKSSLATVNCAAIPKDLLESELFGYEKGAFTGASATGKKGLIEEAADGTLFLDEVGDLSLEAQAKLLRFLELGEFYRVGGSRKCQIKTRVVSATNKNLLKMIEADQFRKDLYFRLGVIKVKVPSLNERPDDILPLAKHFLKEFSDKFHKSFTRISAKVEETLLVHDWTGNVRELKNLMEAAVLVGNGPELTMDALETTFQPHPYRAVPLSDLQDPNTFPPEGIDLAERLQAIETSHIEAALKMARGNESKAARLLHMNHHTFRYRRKKLLP